MCAAVRWCLAVVLVWGLTGCTVLGDQDEPEAASPGGPVELTKIKVMLCCGALDVAPFYLALERKYFADEGMTVEVATARDGGSAVTAVIAGEAQIAFASYTPWIGAQARKVADLRLVADATSLARDNSVVAALPGSSVTRVSDLDGKRVAITALNTMTQYLVMSAAKVNGVNIDSIKWVPTPFPAMAEAMKRGDVDAALLTEPFLMSAQAQYGVLPIFDTSRGPTQDMPIGGYGALAEVAQKYPRTIAAFQRALARATADGQRDYSLFKPIIAKYGKIPADQVEMLARTTYQTSLDPIRIQRVADLMLEFGGLTERFDVGPMIVPPVKAG